MTVAAEPEAAPPTRPLRRLRWVIVGCVVIGALWAVNWIVLPLVDYYRLPAYARSAAIRVAYAPEIAAIEAAIAAGVMAPGAAPAAAVPALACEPSILRVANDLMMTTWLLEEKLRPAQGGIRETADAHRVLDGGPMTITVNGRTVSGWRYAGTCPGVTGTPVRYEILFDGATIRR